MRLLAKFPKPHCYVAWKPIACFNNNFGDDDDDDDDSSNSIISK